MRKIGLGLLAAILVAGFVLSWAQTALTAPPTQQSDRLTWFTLKAGTSFYMAAVTITQTINKYSDLKLIVHPVVSSFAGLTEMHKQKADVGEALVTSAYSYCWGVRTSIMPDVEEAFPEIRTIMGGAVLWRGWYTRPNTGIKKIEDLKGHTVHYATPGLRIQVALGDDSLRAVGLDPKKDVKQLNFDSTPAADKALVDGKVDACLSSISGGKIEELIATTGLVVLPMPPEVYNKYRPDVKMATQLRELPAGYIKAITQKQYVLGEQRLVVCRADLDDKAAYTIVKTIMEHGKEVETVSPDLKEYAIRDYAVPHDFIVPFHPGAIKYLKEIKLWTAADDARQKELLAKLPKPGTKAN